MSSPINRPSLSRWRRWQRFWVKRSRPSGVGRIAAWIAIWKTPPLHGRSYLSRLHPRGFVAPTVSIDHPRFTAGTRVYLGDHVHIYSLIPEAGRIELADDVQIYGDTSLSTGAGGRISIGAGTHVQPGAHLHAYLADIRIGRQVEIAPRCAFYSYNHAVEPDRVIMEQSLESKGPIVVGDGAWLAHGVIVLAGVTIGRGAVIGAGSVVTRDVPENAIAAGSPAKVLGYRGGRAPTAEPLPLPSQHLTH